MSWKTFVRDFLFLLVLATLIILFAVLPYYDTRSREDSLSNTQHRQALTQYNQCRTEAILVKFLDAASSARRKTATENDKVGINENKKLSQINNKTARTYIRLSRQAKALPHQNCQKILR